eukprot:scaffold44687_cov22-Tisochrysis_lutea.AAC.1
MYVRACVSAQVRLANPSLASRLRALLGTQSVKQPASAAHPWCCSVAELDAGNQANKMFSLSHDDLL